MSQLPLNQTTAAFNTEIHHRFLSPFILVAFSGLPPLFRDQHVLNLENKKRYVQLLGLWPEICTSQRQDEVGI
jgi:hypothetical protein